MKLSDLFVGRTALDADLVLVDDGQAALLRYLETARGDLPSNGTGADGETGSQAEAIELPHHSRLKPEYRGMYIRYDSWSWSPDQHWGRPETVRLALQVAYNWWHYKFQPVVMIGDVSARTFAETECHSAHRGGTHFDMDLVGILPKDPGYGRDAQLKCAQLAWFAIQAGVSRVLFADPVVAEAVNRLATERCVPGRALVRPDHHDHFHMEISS